MKRVALAAPAAFIGSTVDQQVSQRIRRRRILLGITQQQLADLIGITCQQTQKYERGINRVSSGRLYQIAQALGVEISYFFEDADPIAAVQAPPTEHFPQQRRLLELARNFTMIKSRKHQEAICNLARALNHRNRRTP